MTLRLPPIITDGNRINDLLRHLVVEGGDDLLVISEDIPMMKWKKKIVPLVERTFGASEVQLMAKCLNGGIPVEGLLGQGKQIDRVYSLPLTPEKELLRSDYSGRPDPEHTYRFRLNIVACESPMDTGIKITARRIASTPPHYRDVGLSDVFIEAFLGRKVGINLFAGPTGSGKSTSLAAILAFLLNKPDANENIITCEAPIEYVYYNVDKPSSQITQMECGRDVESFSAAVRSMMRMAPTSILVGEMRDEETIKAACTAALTGHRVMSTVHSNNVAGIIPRCLGSATTGISQLKADLIATVNTLVAQRLVRGTQGMVAIRETLHVNNKTMRRDMAKCKLEEFESFMDDLVQNYGVSFCRDAEEKLAQGLIDESTFGVFSGEYA